MDHDLGHDRREDHRAEAGPDHLAAPRVAVHLGQDVAEDVAQREEEVARAEHEAADVDDQGRRRLAQQAPAQPDTDGILRLVGRFAAAHACPVAPDLALTSAHVTDLRPFDRTMPAFPVAWSDAAGLDGWLTPLRVEGARDLALMQSDRPFARYYAVAPASPVAGDRLLTLGYDWRRRVAMYGPRVFAVVVLRVVARTVVFEPEIQPGSSGACVLNAAGEVVAVNAAVHRADDSRAVGVAVGVWGERY